LAAAVGGDSGSASISCAGMLPDSKRRYCIEALASPLTAACARVCNLSDTWGARVLSSPKYGDSRICSALRP
jgi:hypothetical protein